MIELVQSKVKGQGSRVKGSSRSRHKTQDTRPKSRDGVRGRSGVMVGVDLSILSFCIL
jgi:hypothetical protein